MKQNPNNMPLACLPGMNEFFEVDDKPIRYVRQPGTVNHERLSYLSAAMDIPVNDLIDFIIASFCNEHLELCIMSQLSLEAKYKALSEEGGK